jgi:hypothetical protein
MFFFSSPKVSGIYDIFFFISFLTAHYTWCVKVWSVPKYILPNLIIIFLFPPYPRNLMTNVNDSYMSGKGWIARIRTNFHVSLWPTLLQGHIGPNYTLEILLHTHPLAFVKYVYHS